MLEQLRQEVAVTLSKKLPGYLTKIMKHLNVVQHMAAEQYFILSITILHCDYFCIAVSKKMIKACQNKKEVSGYIEKSQTKFQPR
jgi:hypothetical protein